MDLLTLIVVLVVVGVCLYLIPMDPDIKRVIVVVVALVVCLWLLEGLGIIHLRNLRFGG